MSKKRLFGTDGVRGVANEGLTATLALQLGMAAGHWVRQSHGQDDVSGARDTVIVGRDTRLSGDMLEAALAAGLAAMGVNVVNVGIVPTPAVSKIVQEMRAAAGVVISASHNPFEDNGIKFFGPNGKKLPDAVEDEIEAILHNLDTIPRPTGGNIGQIAESSEPVAYYVTHVKNTMLVSEASIAGLKLAVDCANGAAYEIAPRILRELGADVTLLHDHPNGININVHCGSTRPQDVAAKVVEIGAAAGLAFDGDADRVMLADEQGSIVDGDRMMAIIALHLRERNRLPGDVVVATIMSNVGLEQALDAQGIRLQRTDVGDRYVAEAMDGLGAAIGGEQSGHILLPYLTPTGDGLVTALQVLAVMQATGKPLSALASIVESCPQLLKNVRVQQASRLAWRDDEEVQEAIRRGRERLGKAEWLSVRPSGTEPLIRVMAQGTEQADVEAVVEEICGLIERKYGAGK